MASKPDYSDRPIWLLCEGNDCYHFFIRVVDKLSLGNIYCFDVRGIYDSDFFRGISAKSNYNSAKIVVYIRDSEYPATNSQKSEDEHYDSVVQSIKTRFESIELMVGDKPIELTDNGYKKAGYIILTNSGGKVGTLEDLVLDMVRDSDAVDDATEMLDVINEKRNGKVMSHAHKRKLHIAFALNEDDKIVGAKTGQVVEYNGVNLDDERFKDIREFLERHNKKFPKYTNH